MLYTGPQRHFAALVELCAVEDGATKKDHFADNVIQVLSSDGCELDGGVIRQIAKRATKLFRKNLKLDENDPSETVAGDIFVLLLIGKIESGDEDQLDLEVHDLRVSCVRPRGALKAVIWSREIDV